MKHDSGRVARTAGLVITTAISSAAIQHTTWALQFQFICTAVVIFLGAIIAAMASDSGGPEA